MGWSGTLRVLLIDDDDVDAALFRRFAGRMSNSVEIDHCSMANRVVGIVTEQDYDVLVLDNRLPGATGLEILGAIRAAGYDGPVVHCTGLWDERLREDFADLECSVVLEKGSISSAAIEDAITAALRTPA